MPLTNTPRFSSIILTGRPGSGKGTQAKRLAEEFGWLHFSTGDKFRELRTGKGPLAQHVREVYDAGELLPDWFANYLFEDMILRLGSTAGVVFDGYPRTRTQAERMATVMEWLERPFIAVDLAVNGDEAMRRMLSRANEEFRPDSSTEEQVRVRLATYDAHTAPVLAFFEEKGLLITLDGEKTPDEVAADIRSALCS